MLNLLEFSDFKHLCYLNKIHIFAYQFKSAILFGPEIEPIIHNKLVYENQQTLSREDRAFSREIACKQ